MFFTVRHSQPGTEDGTQSDGGVDLVAGKGSEGAFELEKSMRWNKRESRQQ
jgi:hypothetical protein